MPPLFAAAIGFSPSPAAVALVSALLPQLEVATPLHFGSVVGPIDALITPLVIACVRALVLCTEYHAAPAVFDPATLIGATVAIAEAGGSLATAASKSEAACVSTLHSAGLFSFLGMHSFLPLAFPQLWH